MIKKILFALGAASFTFFLSACAITDVNHYKDVKPQLDLEKFFLGSTDAWGMFQQRNGAVVKRFHVVIDTKKIGDELVLDERFVYDDGSKQQRIWRLRKNADGRWVGKADDVKGDAQGELAGNAFKWQYTLLLPVDGSVYEMAMDDWMYLIDENTMVNRAKMSKFGFEVGEVTLFFRRRG
jgi:hypothetical protein